MSKTKRLLSSRLALLALATFLATATWTEAAYVAPAFTPTGMRWWQMYRQIQQLSAEASRNNRQNSAACYRAAACYRQIASINLQAAAMFRSAAATSREPSHVNWFRTMDNGCRIAASSATDSARTFQRWGDYYRRIGR